MKKFSQHFNLFIYGDAFSTSLHSFLYRSFIKPFTGPHTPNVFHMKSMHRVHNKLQTGLTRQDGPKVTMRACLNTSAATAITTGGRLYHIVLSLSGLKRYCTLHNTDL